MTWSAASGTSFTLGEGIHAAGTVEVRQVDVAGNVGQAAVLGPITVDQTEAAPTGVTVSSSGTTVTGLGDPGATVTVTAPDGTTVLGSGQVALDGTFSVAIPVQADGVQLGVAQTDLAGNSSSVEHVTAPELFQLVDDIAAPSIDLSVPATQTGTLGSASYLLGISALGALNLSVLGTPAINFTVAAGHQLDTVFNYSALLSLGALDNLHVVIQQLVDGQWQSTTDSSSPYDLISLSLLGGQVQAGTTLDGGTYRAFLAGDTGVLDASLLGNLSVSGTDHNYTVAPTSLVISATGDVLANDVAPAGAVIGSVMVNGTTTAVNASGTTTINGAYGTLTIAANGTYTYTPTNTAADIGKAETFHYTVSYGGQTAAANLYVQVGSPEANLTWDSTFPGNNASFNGGAVNDTSAAEILNATHHSSVDQVLTNLTTSGSVTVLGSISSSTSTTFVVESNATAVTTLHLQVTGTTGLALGLLPTYTVHVTGPDGTDYTTTAAAVLTGGLTALDVVIPGQLASGTYQVTVSSSEVVAGIGAASYTTQVSVHEDVSHTNQFDAHSVNGNLLSNDGQTVPFVGISVGHDTTFTAVAAGGTTVAGSYGTLTVNADGSYHYQPNAGLTYDPANPTPLHDTFDYNLTYPNGTSSLAHLDVTIDVPGVTFNGTAGADTVHSTGGNDTFTLGAGADTVTYDNLPAGNGHDVWTDFNATQGDKIDLSNLLTNVSADQSNLPTYLQVHQQSVGASTNTVVSVDPTGTGHFADLITLSGVNLTLDQLKDHLVTAHQI
jgi:Ca2+-binding RTX toxin-like protein